MRLRRRRPSGPVPDSICPLPWVNLSVDVDGSSRPCCKFAHLDDASAYQLSNLRDGGLRAVWNSAAMQRLRRDFRAGRRPEECRTCWDEEAAGITSWRQSFLADRDLQVTVDYDEQAPDHPVALDLKLSNTCNLRCRICGPVASSSWAAEVLSDEGAAADPYVRDNRAWFKAPKLVGPDADDEALSRWLGDLQHVEMTGGEPMLSRENARVVDLICGRGDPGRVSLLVTTNATVVDDAMVARFPHFAAVHVVLSIDDIGERLTYQRAPASWEVVQATIGRWATTRGVTDLSVNCSVSVFNVWDLAEVLDWFTDHHPDLPVHLNLVHNPVHLSVQHLPPPLRDDVVGRLDAYRADPQRPADLRRQVDQVAAFVRNGGDDGSTWRRTLEEIRHRDEVRGEAFADVYPGLWARIEELGLDDAAEPQPVPVQVARRPAG